MSDNERLTNLFGEATGCTTAPSGDNYRVTNLFCGDDSDNSVKSTPMTKEEKDRVNEVLK